MFLINKVIIFFVSCLLVENFCLGFSGVSDLDCKNVYFNIHKQKKRKKKLKSKKVSKLSYYENTLTIVK